MEIVKKLMLHVDKAEGTTYRDELLTKIIDICSQSNYQYITNFEWYEQSTHTTELIRCHPVHFVFRCQKTLIHETVSWSCVPFRLQRLSSHL